MRVIGLAVVLAISLAFVPPAAEAQRPKVPTIGILVIGAPSSETFWRVLRDELRELGYIEGRTVRFGFRSDQGQAGRLPELAAELVRLKVDVIVPYFTPAARAAKQATREIPIVATAGDFIATGLVDSLARPGGNITGVSAAVADLAGKCVELVREMLSSARCVAALANAPDPFSKPFLEKIRLASEATGNHNRSGNDLLLRGVRCRFSGDVETPARCSHRSTQPADEACRRTHVEAPDAGRLTVSPFRRRRRADESAMSWPTPPDDSSKTSR